MNKRIKDIAEIHGRVGWKGYTTEDLTPEGPLVLGANDITDNNYLDLSNVKHLTREKYEESPEIFVKINDILVVKVGSTIGKVCIINRDIGEASINPNCVIVRATKINPYYLYYYLCSPAGRSYLLNHSSASGQPALNQKDLGEMEIPIIDEKEQLKIASFLRRIDRKIEVNNGINDNLLNYSSMLFNYWFTQFDFPDENNRPYKSSGGKMLYNRELGTMIPASWKAYCLNDLCKFGNGINYDKSEKGDKQYKIVNVRNITSSKLFINKNELDDIVLKSSNADKYLISENDILIARSGTPGAVRLLPNYHNTLYCGFIIHCCPNNPVHKYYLTYCLKRLEGSNATKTGGSILQNVSQDTLKQLIVIIPDKTTLQKFNEICEKLSAEINYIIEQNNLLIKRRDWLLPMLMNGQATIS